MPVHKVANKSVLEKLLRIVEDKDISWYKEDYSYLFDEDEFPAEFLGIEYGEDLKVAINYEEADEREAVSKLITNSFKSGGKYNKEYELGTINDIKVIVSLGDKYGDTIITKLGNEDKLK